MIASPCVPAGTSVLTITQVTDQIKDVLEGEFPAVWVVGELTKVNLHRSGHLYIDAKDAGAVLKMVMWRTAVQRLPELPVAGTEVFMHGRVTVYAPQGNYQLNIDQI